MPEWWDDSCAADASLLDDVEFRVARFLGLPLDQVRDPELPLFGTAVEGIRLRHSRDLDADRLLPAVHAGTEVAAAVARNEKVAAIPPNLPPPDPAAWRKDLIPSGGAIDLEVLLADLWRRGIAVVFAEKLPSPKYQGMACIVEGRPVVVLGRAHDEPPRVAFLVAHEVAHLVYGDCEPGQPMIDEEEAVDVSEVEVRADEYAWRLLTGRPDLPEFDAPDFKRLADRATELEAESGIDAGFLVWSWANRTGAFPVGAMALKALYLHRGGLDLLRRYASENIDAASASETDRSLLACIAGAGAEPGGAAG